MPKIYTNELGQYHRIDGPAREFPNGDREWWLNDNRHRTNGPAVEYANGNKEWWINGKRHRENGPAIENGNSKFWFLNGQRHREDGPASIYRLDTAVVEYNNKMQWWLYGEFLFELQFHNLHK